jgi:hypothetical protein
MHKQRQRQCSTSRRASSGPHRPRCHKDIYTKKHTCRHHLSGTGPPSPVRALASPPGSMLTPRAHVLLIRISLLVCSDMPPPTKKESSPAPEKTPETKKANDAEVKPDVTRFPTLKPPCANSSALCRLAREQPRVTVFCARRASPRRLPRPKRKKPS